MGIFNQIENERIKKNTFDLSHSKKLSGKIGNLIPIMTMDLVPGDSVTVQPNVMLRFAPLIAPVMHRVNVFIHYYFVPNRIVWKDWENFITGGEDGLDNTVWAHVKHSPSNYTAGTLPDYMGLPIDTDEVNGTSSANVSSMPFAMYQKIWNEYYRDQALQEKVVDTVPAGEMIGQDAQDIRQLKKRAWQHDYFTSALPWTQKGPEAMLPLGTEAPVVAYNETLKNPQQARLTGTSAPTGPGSVDIDLSSLLTDGTNFSYIDLMNSHYADLSNATAASINDLRRAFKLQEWLEKNARGGSRYIEFIKIHFGVDSSDKRLQRPEFIGGMKTPVKISEVLQTSNNDTQDTPQGNMAGHAISVGGGDSFNYRAEEHGYIIGIMSIMPLSAYQQGIPRHWSREDNLSYYFKEFAHIGEQPIYNKELVQSGDPDWNDEVFGYTPRFAEYKFQNNTVHGDFKNTLDFWHMGRKFATEPALNSDFIECDYTEIDRIFAVQDGSDNMWVQILNTVKANRPMPIFGTPHI